MKNKRIIKKNHEFQEIISLKKQIKNKSFVIYFRENENKEFRYGISVGKKIGNAVVRNKTKRQIRMTVKEFLKYQKPIPFDIIIIARSNLIKSNQQTKIIDLKYLIGKIKK